MYRGCNNETYESTPMEIQNFEERKLDRERNACFKCQKISCRPYRSAKKSTNVSVCRLVEEGDEVRVLLVNPMLTVAAKVFQSAEENECVTRIVNSYFQVLPMEYVTTEID